LGDEVFTAIKINLRPFHLRLVLLIAGQKLVCGHRLLLINQQGLSIFHQLQGRNEFSILPVRLLNKQAGV
jgi:hypothetical protein